MSAFHIPYLEHDTFWNKYHEFFSFEKLTVNENIQYVLFNRDLNRGCLVYMFVCVFHKYNFW